MSRGAPRPARTPRRAAALALLLLPALLAGCTVERPAVEGDLPGRRAPPVADEGPAPEDPAAPAPVPETSIEDFVLPAPVWVRGDSWKFTIADRRGGGPQQLVVAGEAGPDYLVVTTDPEDAVTAAFLGRSLPGRVGKAFLSGYDHGVPTRYFDFPLQQNKTWNLHVRQTDFAVRATYAPSVEGGRGPGFLVEGAAISGDTIFVTYAASVKWMTRFEAADANGVPYFTRTLQAYEPGYTGPYYTATSTDLYVATRSNASAVPQPLDTFVQPGSFDRLRLLIACQGQGLVDLRILDPANQLVYNFTASSGTVAQADLPARAGTWQVAWTTAQMDVQVRVAGITVREGSI